MFGFSSWLKFILALYWVTWIHCSWLLHSAAWHRKRVFSVEMFTCLSWKKGRGEYFLLRGKLWIVTFVSLHFSCFILFHNICYGLHVATHARGWLEWRHEGVSSDFSSQRNQRLMFVLNRSKVLWRIAAKYIRVLCISFHAFHHKRHCASVENWMGKKE